MVKTTEPHCWSGLFIFSMAVFITQSRLNVILVFFDVTQRLLLLFWPSAACIGWTLWPSLLVSFFKMSLWCSFKTGGLSLSYAVPRRRCNLKRCSELNRRWATKQVGRMSVSAVGRGITVRVNQGALTSDLRRADVELNAESLQRTWMTSCRSRARLPLRFHTRLWLCEVFLNSECNRFLWRLFQTVFDASVSSETLCGCTFVHRRHLNQSSVVGSDKEHYLQSGPDYPTHNPFFHAQDKITDIDWTGAESTFV